jgi:hypothetical protein
LGKACKYVFPLLSPISSHVPIILQIASLYIYSGAENMSVWVILPIRRVRVKCVI